ncbi:MULTISPECIES: class I SAM-dependent methyltransferase [unclassified Tolypothrix]|uniref:class I SAM-dependent methyltransferase n=1 Tax=unclassified Tolypothrix TaxID=2649714 RepID=UPI0005EABECF|nr:MULTISPECIES: class I SAM-dependent methyltransferase [unclassified Tolypothrix]BAY89934.1 putative MerR-family transcriptional regulator [Microchaete diplosiphon NIES-3275]EKE96952.1 SAM-dependent methyltransferase [Tolypothrix sp. PCC 7601]MBE9082126.1 class I SAM-dependent methyltransferase [Tolypothrix sp. LEGE 11397]UYD24169.1 class I SAM-dependent methyltransferase [Tolypothrix sp. PCC 7712]UYD33601.1 class I SAM-dependent methyltransferase [Tolypothrix sp. PCC 7601]
MPLYDSIGQQYTTTRIPDYRIVEKIIDLLNLPTGSLIADIGAGTGGYSQALANRGFSVYAVEPSSIMRQQASAHPQVQWFNGYAEALPLADKSVDGVISILTIHHFSDLDKAFREMHRIIQDGPIILLSFDIRFAQRIWLYDYFPWMWEDALKFLPLHEITSLIEQNTQRKIEVIPLMLPDDLSDLFAAAAWKRPELYLQPEVRAGISSFALGNPDLIASGVKSLAADLSSGKWDAKYGDIRQITAIDAGYRFFKATIVN